MLNKRRVDATLKLFVFGILCYGVMKYTLMSVGVVRDECTGKSTNQTYRQTIDNIKLKNSNITTAHVYEKECKEVYLAYICNGNREAVQLFWSMKSLLYFRSSPLKIVIYADHTAKYVLEELFKTWDLPCVDVTFYKGKPEKVSPSVIAVSNTLQKAIYLHNEIRFMSDVTELQTLYDSLSAKEKSRFQVPARWRINPVSNELTWISEQNFKAFSSEPGKTRFIQKNQFLNYQIEDLLIILKQDGNLYRKISPQLKNCTCSKMESYKTTISLSKLPKNNVNQVTSCAEYILFAYSLKRTLLYFHGNADAKYSDPADISLVTQLTIDRWSVLERFIQLWKGPMVALLYVTDIDAYNLQNILLQSIVRKRANVDIHLVFKSKHLYPINELRNIALRQVKTAYTLFVDVDLVPNPTLYNDLKVYIKKYLLSQSGLKTLIVPAFEAFKDLNEIPKNKTQLLKYMEQKQVDGYKMWRAWNLGHKPTDYPRWKQVNESYIVKWRDAYEPYVVLATKNITMYEPVLLERMADKIAYGLELYAKGYEFRVLADVFLIHLPHPASPGSSLWATDGKYFGCGGKLFQAIKKDVFTRFPKYKY